MSQSTVTLAQAKVIWFRFLKHSLPQLEPVHTIVDEYIPDLCDCRQGILDDQRCMYYYQVDRQNALCQKQRGQWCSKCLSQCSHCGLMVCKLCGDDDDDTSRIGLCSGCDRCHQNRWYCVYCSDQFACQSCEDDNQCLACADRYCNRCKPDHIHDEDDEVDEEEASAEEEAAESADMVLETCEEKTLDGEAPDEVLNEQRHARQSAVLLPSPVPLMKAPYSRDRRFPRHCHPS